ncbi:DUF6049 family protein [Saxibacter everestensis]|uniref:DUF6049 family protein n=1 Tax=Saxibacter everestensis TaxID=2909229 RepID=A0ABY8QS37_9MICO|nr:DUF6049 family protein [Brevibacteriaceae bacterium ZFBP1038]
MNPTRPQRMVRMFLLLIIGSALTFAGVPALSSAQAGTTAPTRTATTPATQTNNTAAQPTATKPATSYLELGSVSAGINPDTKLEVSGRIVNNSDSDLDKPRLRLLMKKDLLRSRDQLADWAAEGSAGSIIASSHPKPEKDEKKPEKGTPEVPDKIKAHSTHDFRFSIDADKLGLPTFNPDSSWGPRGIAVQLSGDPGSDQGLRSYAPGFTTWYPDPNLVPSKITTLLPVAGPTEVESDGLLSADSLEAAAGPDGPLQNLLDGTGASDVTWSIDPQLIRSIQQRLAEAEQAGQTEDGEAPQSPSAEASEQAAGESAVEDLPQLRRWYTTFLEQSKNRSLIATPWADPDLRALSHSRLADILKPAANEGDSLKDVFPGIRSDVAWPSPGTADTETLVSLRKAGYQNVIVSDEQQQSPESFTPTGRASIDIPGRNIDSLITDTTLSDLLGQLDPDAPRGDSAQHQSPVTPAQQISRIAAETAAISNERTSDSRSVLMAAPRGFSADPAVIRQLVTTLEDAPWIETQGIDDLTDLNAEVSGSYDSSADGKSLPVSTLNDLSEIRDEVSNYNSALDDPVAADTEFRRRLLGFSATHWVGNPEWPAKVTEFSTATAKAAGSIRAVTGSTVTLITGDKTEIPIQVENGSDREANIKVALEAQTGQLRGGTSQTMAIQPGGSARVTVPVRGVANGDVKVWISVLSQTGKVVAGPAEQTVRVRADWENIGTAIVGGLLAIVLIAGITKTVMGGRRKVPETQLAAAVAESEKRLDTAELKIIAERKDNE